MTKTLTVKTAEQPKVAFHRVGLLIDEWFESKDYMSKDDYITVVQLTKRLDNEFQLD